MDRICLFINVLFFSAFSSIFTCWCFQPIKCIHSVIQRQIAYSVYFTRFSYFSYDSQNASVEIFGNNLLCESFLMDSLASVWCMLESPALKTGPTFTLPNMCTSSEDIYVPGNVNFDEFQLYFTLYSADFKDGGVILYARQPGKVSNRLNSRHRVRNFFEFLMKFTINTLESIRCLFGNIKRFQKLF